MKIKFEIDDTVVSRMMSESETFRSFVTDELIKNQNPTTPLKTNENDNILDDFLSKKIDKIYDDFPDFQEKEEDRQY